MTRRGPRAFARAVGGSLREALRPDPPASRGEGLVLATILVVGALVRAIYLGEPIRFDEAASALYYSDRSLLHALGGLAGNANHNLQSVLAWASLRVFGWHEVAVRLPAFLSGIALPAILWASTRRLTASATAGLLAAALAATSPGLAFFSVNGRGYEPQTVLVALLVAVVLAARDKPTSGAAAAAGILTAIGAFAVSTMLVFAVGLGLGFLAIAADRRGAARFSALWTGSAMAAALPLFAVAVVGHGPRGLLGHVPKMAEPVPRAVAETAQAFGSLLRLLWDWHDARLAWLGVVVLAAGLAVGRTACGPLATLAGTVAMAGVALTPLTHVGLYPRVLLPMAALLVPWAAIGLDALARRRALRIATVVLVLVVYPGAWVHADLLRRHNSTGDVPEGRALAAALLARDDLASALVALPPLYDVVVAFYFRGAAVDRGGLVGFDLAYDPSRSCAATSLLVYRAAGEDAAVVAARAAPWRARLAGEGDLEVRPAGVEGELWRFALAPCTVRPMVARR